MQQYSPVDGARDGSEKRTAIQVSSYLHSPISPPGSHASHAALGLTSARFLQAAATTCSIRPGLATSPQRPPDARHQDSPPSLPPQDTVRLFSPLTTPLRNPSNPHTNSPPLSPDLIAGTSYLSRGKTTCSHAVCPTRTHLHSPVPACA